MVLVLDIKLEIRFPYITVGKSAAQEDEGIFPVAQHKQEKQKQGMNASCDKPGTLERLHAPLKTTTLFL